MKNVKDSYTSFHKSHNPEHVYPTEWVIRTLSGTYPHLSLDKSKYFGARILDVGFGDGRNWPLLHNLGFNICGMEVTEDIVELGKSRGVSLGIPVQLKTGANAAIPFDDAVFDFILACHSCYYVDAGTTFSDNLREFSRVLKPGGMFIASLPEPNGDILKGGTEREDGHVEIRHDPWGLRNGYVFKSFRTEDEIRRDFSKYFENISIGHCFDNYYGVQINVWLFVGQKFGPPSTE